MNYKGFGELYILYVFHTKRVILATISGNITLNDVCSIIQNLQTSFKRKTCFMLSWTLCHLIHWSRVTHICVCNLTIIGSDNGLSPDRRQAIIWTNAGILLIGCLETNFSEIWIKIHTYLFKKMHLKMSSGKCRPFYLGLNVLMTLQLGSSPSAGTVRTSPAVYLRVGAWTYRPGIVSLMNGGY